MNRIITQSSDVVRFVLPSLLWTFSVFGSQKWIGSSPEPAMWCCAPAPGRPRGERPTRLSPPSWRWSVRGRSYAGSCSRGQTQDSWRFKSGGPATAVLSRLILFILFLWVKEVNQLVTCLFVFSVHLNCFFVIHAHRRSSRDVALPAFLESQGCHLIFLSYRLFCSSVWSSSSYCRILYLLMAHSPDFFLRKFSYIFPLRDSFLYGPFGAARRW